MAATETLATYTNINAARTACDEAAAAQPGKQFYVVPAGKRRYRIASFYELRGSQPWPVPVYAMIVQGSQ